MKNRLPILFISVFLFSGAISLSFWLEISGWAKHHPILIGFWRFWYRKNFGKNHLFLKLYLIWTFSDVNHQYSNFSHCALLVLESLVTLACFRVVASVCYILFQNGLFTFKLYRFSVEVLDFDSRALKFNLASTLSHCFIFYTRIVRGLGLLIRPLVFQFMFDKIHVQL